MEYHFDFLSPKSALVGSLVYADMMADLAKLYERQNTSTGADKPVTETLEKLKNPAANRTKNDDPEKIKICIVGAGMSGLYSAFILKYLGIDYDILEADPVRAGGRIYTHNFSEPNPGERHFHDYYDVGGMRFPNTPIMKRTFRLFDMLDIGKPGAPDKPEYRLIPYLMKGKNCPTRYNDVTAVLPDDTEVVNEAEVAARDPDPFRVSVRNGGTVPHTRVSAKATAEIMDDAYERFRVKIQKALKMDGKTVVQRANRDEALKSAFEYLLRHDKYSLRDYLQNVEGYDPETVHWAETTDSATGWFDQAFVENVLESLAFDYKDTPAVYTDENGEEQAPDGKWYCIEGGSRVMVDRLLARLEKGKVRMGKQVIRMELLPEGGREVKVTYRNHLAKDDKMKMGEDQSEQYSAVINTTTLGALQKIDLTKMGLPYGMKTAIRVLRYDASSKVGVRFKEMWWLKPRFNQIVGGVAKTDMSIRMCVYPSYNIHDDVDKPGVLLASYSWGQDSERVAAHIGTDSPASDHGLRELIVYNLARLHTISEPANTYDARFDDNKKYIDDQWDTHHAYDWTKDRWAAGAFALFGPGQFTTLIPHLVKPASRARFVIVGEHASANHAWVVGALDSAVRGLSQILTGLGLEDQRQRMIAEFGNVEEIPQELVEKQVILSQMLTNEDLHRLGIGRAVQTPALVGSAGTTV